MLCGTPPPEQVDQLLSLPFQAQYAPVKLAPSYAYTLPSAAEAEDAVATPPVATAAHNARPAAAFRMMFMVSPSGICIGYPRLVAADVVVRSRASTRRAVGSAWARRTRWS